MIININAYISSDLAFGHHSFDILFYRFCVFRTLLADFHNCESLMIHFIRFVLT